MGYALHPNVSAFPVCSFGVIVFENIVILIAGLLSGEAENCQRFDVRLRRVALFHTLHKV